MPTWSEPGTWTKHPRVPGQARPTGADLGLAAKVGVKQPADGVSHAFHGALNLAGPTPLVVSASARTAVRLDLLRFAPSGKLFPGRKGAPGSPVIADIRGALSNMRLRNLILHELGAILAEDFADAEVVSGVAKAGICWAAMLADRAAKPAAVVNLDGPRASGLQRQVEGDVAGRRVLLIDNLVALGGSLQQAAGVVAGAGGEVIGALTVIADPGATLEFKIRSLWTQRELIDAAFDVGRIDGEIHRRLTKKETKQ